VYLTGLVRDKQRRKMSKSLNSHPLDLIEKFGADGVRVGLLLSASAEMTLCLMKNYATRGKDLPIKYGMLSN
jgi:valyl-tRNA synthetase